MNKLIRIYNYYMCLFSCVVRVRQLEFGHELTRSETQATKTKYQHESTLACYFPRTKLVYSVWLQKHQMKTILFCIACCLFVCLFY